LENLDDDDDDDDDDAMGIYRAWKSTRIRKNTTVSSTDILRYCQLKEHKAWFDEEYSELLNERKHAKL